MMGGAILGLAIMVSGLAPGPEMLFLTLGVLAGIKNNMNHEPTYQITSGFTHVFLWAT